MEAQSVLDIISGLACVVICFLLWILFRIEKQLQELGLRVGIIEKDLQEMFEEKSVRKGRKEGTGNETDGDSVDESLSGRLEKMEEMVSKITDSLEKRIEDSVESIPGRLEKIEESIQNASEITETLRKDTSIFSETAEQMKEQIECSFTKSKFLEESLERIRSDILKVETILITAPLNRYRNLRTGHHIYTTVFDRTKLGIADGEYYAYDGVVGHVLRCPVNGINPITV